MPSSVETSARGGELALAAVDQHKVRPRRPRVLVGRRCRGRIRRRRFVDQPLEPPASTSRIMAKSSPACQVSDLMLNLRYWFLRNPSGPATTMPPTALLPWMWLLS